jgi:D-glycero-alpha-D-manno-heptose 1-phosphate guanylyltransferase
MQVIILAGGLGTRLRPLTYKIPKPMVPILGKPFLEYQLLMLRDLNIKDIILSIGFLGSKIQEYFKDGKKYGINIRYCLEEKPLGTGGCLRLAQDLLNEDFLVLYGDSYLPIDYNTAYDDFKKHDTQCLLITYDNSDDTTVPCNIAVNSDNYVTKYIKDSTDETLKRVDAGAFFLKKSVLDSIPKNKVVSFEGKIFPKIISEHQMLSWNTSQRFYDIGLPERLLQFEEIMK